jgi:hypothetical protein
MLIAASMLTAMFLAAAAVLWLIDRGRDLRHRDRRPPGERAAPDASYGIRLLNPKWAEVSSLTGGRPSTALLRLYADHEVIQKRELVVSPQMSEDPTEEHIACFHPADKLTFDDEWVHHLPSGSFPLARDITGDLIFVELRADGEDGPVKHWYHDGGDVEVVSSSVSEFHAWCHAPQPRAGGQQPSN